MYARSDPYTLKCFGNVETPADCVTDDEKEEFIQAAKEKSILLPSDVL